MQKVIGVNDLQNSGMLGAEYIAFDLYDAHNNLGAVYCQQGLWDMALYEFMKAVRFDPKNASAHKNIGMIYFAKGDKQRAKEYLFQMLKYDPNYLKDAGIYAIVSQLGLIKE